MMMIVEQSVEWTIGSETQLFGENGPQCSSDHYPGHTWLPPISNPGRCCGKLILFLQIYVYLDKGN
jgi:hypothetical protein